jgi:glycosyltransferase involved in cell wall biosynthesis
MKILYIGTRLQVNGATKVAIEHCNMLQCLGHNIRLAVLGNNILMGVNPLVSVEYITSLRKIQIFEDELIVALDSFVANWLVKQYGCKRVVSLIQVDEPSLYSDPTLIKVCKDGFSLPNPKITVSNYLHNILLGYGVDSFIIAPAISKEVFYPAIRSAPENGKTFNVLIVGSYDHPLKQVHIAFTVLEKLKYCGIDVRLTRLVRKIEDNTPKEIDTKWFVDPPQKIIGDIYRSVDALFSASSSEGFGLTLLEAMASGIPFVSTDNGGSRDIVLSNRKNMIVSIGDVDAMKKALYLLATNPILWLDLRNAGLERAKEWSWDNTIIVLEECLKSIYNNAF